MRNSVIVFVLVLLLAACESGPPNHIPDDEFRKVFHKDARNMGQYFVPTDAELLKFEVEFKSYLESLTKSGKGYKINILEKTHPLEYGLGWFKRRYFGRIENDYKRKLFVEFVAIRCGGSDEWQQIDYPSDSNRACWWNVIYDVDNSKIEKIDYPW
ncbi:hypothetical protein BKI52_25125 [marine bacterium AO1-C]|nr:hypothetical protein BKI52_25125 [marine bacterium AO1-C]